MSEPGPAPLPVSSASDASATPWLGILGWCLGITAPAIALTALIGWLVAGPAGALSPLAAGAVVLVFFGLSLLVAHWVGHLAPKAFFGAVAGTYAIKVLGFGLFLLVPTDPSWYDRTWVLIGAIVAVLVWQGAEMYRFSKLRLRIYDDAPTLSGDKPGGAA